MTKEELHKKVEEQRESISRGWEILQYAVEHKDLGALNNAREMIIKGKIKEQTFIDVWFADQVKPS